MNARGMHTKGVGSRDAMTERAKDTFGGKAKGKKAKHRQLMLLNGRIDDLWQFLIANGETQLEATRVADALWDKALTEGPACVAKMYWDLEHVARD